MMNVICPECGSPNVIVYDDGTLECGDCGFFWHIYNNL